MKHLCGTKSHELRNQFSYCAIQKMENQIMPHYFSLSNKISQIAFTFPIATIKLMVVRVRDISPYIATN